MMIANDRTETYVNEIKKALSNNPKIQIVVVIFPSMRDDRYAAIKKTLGTEIPVPSHVINSRTLKNETKNRSIVLKILLQMNCKLGGSLWGMKIPLKKTMICGIDTFHEGPAGKGRTVAGFVATYNDDFTKYYSRPTIQSKKEELVNGIVSSMEKALSYYEGANGYLPESIIVFRDGVSDGQFEFVKAYEVEQFKEAFKRFKPGYEPKFSFVIVCKRITAKFFKYHGGLLQNAPPGSVLDNAVTNMYMYDYYVVSQFCREGTSTPSHYIVLEDNSGLSPDLMQRLTYKLCFLYYNWPGTVRVPAPCQYAHKLADLVGNSIKAPVDEKLADKLHFL